MTGAGADHKALWCWNTRQGEVKTLTLYKEHFTWLTRVSIWIHIFQQGRHCRWDIQSLQQWFYSFSKQLRNPGLLQKQALCHFSVLSPLGKGGALPSHCRCNCLPQYIYILAAILKREVRRRETSPYSTSPPPLQFLQQSHHTFSKNFLWCEIWVRTASVVLLN